MSNFHRFYLPGAITFLTIVTDQRRHYLCGAPALDLFWATLKKVQELHPFHFLAYAILPDHFHCLLKLPGESPNFSVVIQSIKRNYTLNYKKAFAIPGKLNLWQARFWDHVIRDERDLQNHFDYIHWNPVKHGYVEHPEDWEQSSFRHWLDEGFELPGRLAQNAGAIINLDYE